MRNLIEFLTKNIHWFVFVLFEVISVVLLFRYNTYQQSVWFSSANFVAGQVREVDSKVTSYFHLASVNEQLSQRNIELEHELGLLRKQLEGVQALKDTSAIVKSQTALLGQFKLIPAKVVDNSVSSPDNLITINKGTADGVRTDMGVACGTGVVGIVFLASAHYAVVLPLLNTRSNVSCAIQDRGYFGYLHWSSPPSNVAYLDDIPRHAKYKRGDHVVTSGYSSVFPPGIMVGKVGRTYNSPDGLSYRVEVLLSTDFSKLRDVCVINDESSAERLQFLRAAQDSINAQHAGQK